MKRLAGLEADSGQPIAGSIDERKRCTKAKLSKVPGKPDIDPRDAMTAKANLDLRQRLQHAWQRKSPPIKLYAIGTGMLAIGALCAPFARKAPFVSWIFTGSILFFSLGILRECYGAFVDGKDRPIVKLGIAIVTVMSVALATGSGSNVIATATGQDPSAFKTAITFISPLAFIPLFAVFAFALSLLGIPFAMLIGLLERANFNFPLLLGRMLGLVGIMAFSQTALKPDSAFLAFLNDAGGYSAYSLDMHEDPACSITKGDRIIRLNDDLVVVGRITDNGPQFVRKPCPLAPQDKDLAPAKK